MENEDAELCRLSRWLDLFPRHLAASNSSLTEHAQKGIDGAKSNPGMPPGVRDTMPQHMIPWEAVQLVSGQDRGGGGE